MKTQEPENGNNNADDEKTNNSLTSNVNQEQPSNKLRGKDRNNLRQKKSPKNRNSDEVISDDELDSFAKKGANEIFDENNEIRAPDPWYNEDDKSHIMSRIVDEANNNADSNKSLEPKADNKDISGDSKSNNIDISKYGKKSKLGDRIFIPLRDHKGKPNCYPRPLLIGYNESEQRWVLRYGVCEDGELVLSEAFLFLPIVGESAEHVINRCKNPSDAKRVTAKGQVYLDTADPTSIRIPDQLAIEIESIIQDIGYYSITKLLTILVILGDESMQDDIVYGDRLTYGHLSRKIKKYTKDQKGKLNKYNTKSAPYHGIVNMLIDTIKRSMHENDIDFTNEPLVHFNICQHEVRNDQAGRLNRNLRFFKGSKSKYINALRIIKALSLFTPVGKKDPLVSDDDRARYQTIIGKYYDSVVLMAQLFKIDLDE